MVAVKQAWWDVLLQLLQHLTLVISERFQFWRKGDVKGNVGMGCCTGERMEASVSWEKLTALGALPPEHEGTSRVWALAPRDNASGMRHGPGFIYF